MFPGTQKTKKPSAPFPSLLGQVPEGLLDLSVKRRIIPKKVSGTPRPSGNRLLGFLCQLTEYFRLIQSEISQDLPIQTDSQFLETGDKAAVIQ